MSASRTAGVTDLLAAWRAGDESAAHRLAALVYDDLRRMASCRLGGLPARPLQTTELAHEAFERLLERPLQAGDRSHFFRTAALALRQALCDALRRQQADKRGGNAIHLALDADEAVGMAAIGEPPSWFAVEAALADLERHDERKCRVVELTLLLGLSQAEVAEALDVSIPTVERDLRFARAWLRERLAA